MLSLSEAIVHHHTSPRSLERAEDLLQQGAVGQIIQRGDWLQAYVRGSQGDRYLCSFLFQGSRLQEADCSCPYSFEGWCKHLAAMGLTVARQIQPIQVSPSLDTLVESLDVSQLRQLVKQWVLEDPQLLISLEQLAPIADGVTDSAQSMRVDAASYRLEMRELIEESLQVWEYGDEEDPLSEGILELAATVRRFLQAGDARNAQVILAALSEVWAEDNHRLDDYYMESPIGLWDPLWATAILLSQLDPTERIQLQINLETWGAEAGGEYELATLALRQGWDDPDLEAVLAGHSQDLWGDEQPPDGADDLARIRLEILERQDRIPAYLNLARAEGLILEAVLKQIELGQIPEAMTLAQQLPCWEDGFIVGQSLQAQGYLEESLELAHQAMLLPSAPRRRYGDLPLYRPPLRSEFASWASEVAEQLGQPEDALDFQLAAFKDRPTFQIYQQVQKLAGDEWGSLRSDFLHELLILDNPHYRADAVRIYVAEDEVETAIAALGSVGNLSPALVQEVMRIALSSHPDWVLEQARRRAEPILYHKLSRDYDQAVDWVEWCQAAYLEMGQEGEWLAYRAEIDAQYGRQRKLIGLLRDRGL